MMKVLIVDDENLIRYSLSVTLKDENTEVRTAATGRKPSKRSARKASMFASSIFTLRT